MFDSAVIPQTELLQWLPLHAYDHRSLHSGRDAINDAPALYFVVPNKENILRICQVSGLVYNNNIFVSKTA